MEILSVLQIMLFIKENNEIHGMMLKTKVLLVLLVLLVLSVLLVLTFVFANFSFLAFQ